MKVALYSVLTWYLICVALGMDESLTNEASEPLNVYDVTQNKRVPKRGTQPAVLSTKVSVGSPGIEELPVDLPVANEGKELNDEERLKRVAVKRKQREWKPLDDPKTPRETMCKAGCLCT